MPINFKWHLGNIREKLRGGVVVDNSALPWNSETVAGTIYWHTATQADPSSRQSRRSTSPTQGDGVGPSLPSLHLLLWQEILCLHPERYWDRSQVITDSLCFVSRLWHSAAVIPWPLSWCHQDTLPGESDTNMMNYTYQAPTWHHDNAKDWTVQVSAPTWQTWFDFAMMTNIGNLLFFGSGFPRSHIHILNQIYFDISNKPFPWGLDPIDWKSSFGHCLRCCV